VREPGSGSPLAVLASRYNHDGAAVWVSSCARVSSCTCVTGRAGISGRAGVSRCPLASRCPCGSHCSLAPSGSGSSLTPGGSGVSCVTGVTRCALRALRTGWTRTSTERERRQYCDKQFRIPHDDFLHLANENYARYREQPPRFDQFLATMISVGRSGHRYCKAASAADLHA
jgi:hypothetical protein